MRKKTLALLLAMVMTFGLAAPAYAAQDEPAAPATRYTDVSDSHWAKSSIDRWSAAGIINGDENGHMNPDATLKRGELAKILCELLGLTVEAPADTFTDLPAGAWYNTYILRCAAAGIINGFGDGTVGPEQSVTRGQAITMVGRALGAKPAEKADLSKFADGDQVEEWYAGYLTTLTDMGILNGIENEATGELNVASSDNILRSATMALLDKAISAYVTTPGKVVASDPDRFVVVNAKAAGETVTVSGTTAGLLVAAGTTADVETKSLTADTVKVDAPANVTLDKQTKVAEVAVNAAATVENNGAVDTLTVNSEAAIDNRGTVKEAVVNADNVIMDGKAPQKLEVADTVETAPVDSKGNEVTAKPEPTTPSYNGGSTSGGTTPTPTPTPAAETYKVTVTPGTNCTATLSPAATDDKYAEGATVTVTITPESGWVYKSGALEVTTASGKTVEVTYSGDTTATFAMPAEAVTVDLKNVTVEKAPDAVYNLTAAAENGTVAFTVSNTTATTAKEGDEVTVTVTAETGYDVEEVTASGDVELTKSETVANTYTFTMPAADVTVTATFEAKTYEVTLDVNGGDALAEGADKKTVTFGDTFDLGVATKAKDGETEYVFDGWYTTKTATDGTKIDGTKVIDSLFTDGKATFYANFIEKKAGEILVTLKYNDNGKTADKIVSVAKNTESDTSKTFGDLGTPTLTGYDFKGWFNGETEIKSNTPVAADATDMPLEAKWEAMKVKLTINIDPTNTAEVINKVSVNGTEYTDAVSDLAYDSKVTLAATPAEGYDFVGWVSGSDTISTEPSYEYTIASESDITLTAKFAKKSYTITWNANGAQGTTTTTAEHGDTITAPADDKAPTRENYTLKGWSETQTGEVIDFSATDNPITATGDKTYYAIWVKNPSITAEADITLTVDGKALTASADGKYYTKAGDTVTVSIKSEDKDGFIFNGFTYTLEGKETPIKATDNVYTFTMPETDTTVKAAWVEITEATVTERFPTGAPSTADVDFNYKTAYEKFGFSGLNGKVTIDESKVKAAIEEAKNDTAVKAQMDALTRKVNNVDYLFYGFAVQAPNKDVTYLTVLKSDGTPEANQPMKFDTATGTTGRDAFTDKDGNKWFNWYLGAYRLTDPAGVLDDIDGTAANYAAAYTRTILWYTGEQNDLTLVKAEKVSLLRYTEREPGIEVAKCENGTVTVSPEAPAKDATVTITAKPNKDYTVESVTVTYTTADGKTETVPCKDVTPAEPDPSAPANTKAYTFTMPDQFVTISATFKQNTYTVTIAEKIENGTVTADKTEAPQGETITLTVTPAENYVLTDKSLAIKYTEGENEKTIEATKDEDKENTYTFEMPAADVTVSAAFEEIKYTITFKNSADDNKPTTTEVKVGAAITAPETDPTTTDKVFVGWGEVTGEGDAATASLMPVDFSESKAPKATKDVTYQAIWAEYVAAAQFEKDDITTMPNVEWTFGENGVATYAGEFKSLGSQSANTALGAQRPNAYLGLKIQKPTGDNITHVRIGLDATTATQLSNTVDGTYADGVFEYAAVFTVKADESLEAPESGEKTITVTAIVAEGKETDYVLLGWGTENKVTQWQAYKLKAGKITGIDTGDKFKWDANANESKGAWVKVEEEPAPVAPGTTGGNQNPGEVVIEPGELE